jgi:hypothetical protein
MPLISRFLDNDDFMMLVAREDELQNLRTDLLWVVVNGGISLILVLLGGFFAGLTLAYAPLPFQFIDSSTQGLWLTINSG